ncbi:hypothetical protein GQX74_004906 [Glossina fuscipes]|nr:hypothetical protein GQX74_004906 [Glossina fuscipes]
MNHINCAITKCRSVTPKILPAITELIPTGVNHITHVTIFITTSNIAAKKSTTTCPLEPIVPRNVPNTKQKNTIPNVLVPLRYCMTLPNLLYYKKLKLILDPKIYCCGGEIRKINSRTPNAEDLRGVFLSRQLKTTWVHVKDCVQYLVFVGSFAIVTVLTVDGRQTGELNFSTI